MHKIFRMHCCIESVFPITRYTKFTVRQFNIFLQSKRIISAIFVSFGARKNHRSIKYKKNIYYTYILYNMNLHSISH